MAVVFLIDYIKIRHMKINYKNPEKRTGILIWEGDVSFLSREKDFSLRGIGEEEIKERARKVNGDNALYFFTAVNKADSFLVWVSQIKEWDSQKVLSSESSVTEKRSYEDKENGNIISFIDFSSKVLGRKQIKINFSIEVSEIEVEEGSWVTDDYDKSSPLYRKYTKSERQLSQTDDIVKLAEEITRSTDDYFPKAKIIYNWIVENIEHKEKTGERGAIRVFQSKNGNAAELSFLCITLMRSVGIPARLVTGAWGEAGRRQENHFWLEFYLNNVGWVPVDCAKKMFARLDNKRTIFSKGENIILERGPDQSEVFNINYKRVFFMQPEATYINKQEDGLLVVEQNKYLLVKE